MNVRPLTQHEVMSHQDHLAAARFLVERHERIGEGLSRSSGVLLGLAGVEFALLAGVGTGAPLAATVSVGALLLCAALSFIAVLAPRRMLAPSVEDLRRSVADGSDGARIALEQLIGVHDPGQSLVEQYRRDAARRAPWFGWGVRLFALAQLALVVSIFWSQASGGPR